MISRGAVAFPSRSLLAALSEGTRADLLALGTWQEFTAGEQLLRQGERSRHVHVVVDGWVKVTAVSAEGHTTLLAIRVRGDAVGELASLDGAARAATVTAVGHVRARRIGHAELQRLLGEHPDVAVALGSYVSAKLRWATERRIEFGAFSVAVRVARVLVSLAGAYGQPSPHGISLGIEVSQPELASLIGASEPSVHRAVRDLKREGILDVGYRHIVIRDPAALVRTAQLTEFELGEQGPGGPGEPPGH
jgi:CRP-like cAMP-binding protein